YRVDEPFDVFDVNGYDAPGGRTPDIGPLVRPAANARANAWHTGFTNPWVYDAARRMATRGWGRTANEFERRVLAFGANANGTSSTMAAFTMTPDRALSDAEVGLRATTGGSKSEGSKSGGGSKGSSPGGTTSVVTTPILPQDVTVAYMQGMVVPLDFVRVRNEAAQILAAYDSDILTAEDRTWLQSVVAKRYEPMYRASGASTPNYALDFVYWNSDCSTTPKLPDAAFLPKGFVY
ncbi:MAG: hypothetical protein H7X80_03775, partial [bacterium]|nr:hypothetical protein [Candidatus Kapabacteria bacterium]